MIESNTPIPQNQQKKDSFPTLICDYTASSIQEYHDALYLISQNARRRKKKRRDPGDEKYDNDVVPLWFRGHSQSHYQLSPSLLRGSQKSFPQNGSDTYSIDHLREDYRYHHFRSKGNQLVTTFPQDKIEWQEIMQHHFTKTRLMDWSESAVISLMFALEPFINPSENKELFYQRQNLTPTIWVLDPQGLNNHLFDVLAKEENCAMICRALSELRPYDMPLRDLCSLAKRVSSTLRQNKHIYFSSKGSSAALKINGIVCLAVIEAERRANSGRLLRQIESGAFNPFFYLLARYYTDGLIVRNVSLPPLAIVHPYHSNRIQAQRGVFTVVPHYHLEKSEQLAYSAGIDLRALENQPLASDCLYRIRITRPAHVARELLLAGERRASLYPELEVYAKDIEAYQYHV